MIHKSVLLKETIEGLKLSDGDIVLDATFGAGGHSKAILDCGSEVKVIAMDADSNAIENGKDIFSDYGERIIFVNDNFTNLTSALEKHGIKKINKAIFDFGLSSDQIEHSGRGFSFMKNEPLDMTLGGKKDITTISAYNVVNEWSEDTLKDILMGFGEERYARRIAKAITKARETRPIESTMELVEVIKDATPRAYHHGKIHPATRTFQAIRIAVNSELVAIEEGLKQSFKMLTPGGRIVAISFHSLEDRIVKNMFRDWARVGQATLPVKKPIVPSDEEVSRNPRSRSAKLRIIEKVNES